MDVILHLCHEYSLIYLIISEVMATYSPPSSRLLNIPALISNSGKPWKERRGIHRKDGHRISLSAFLFLPLMQATFSDCILSV